MIAEPRRLALLEAGKLKLAAKARLAEVERPRHMKPPCSTTRPLGPAAAMRARIDAKMSQFVSRYQGVLAKTPAFKASIEADDPWRASRSLDREIDRFLKVFPGDAKVWSIRSRHYLQAGDVTAAWEAIQRARELMPEETSFVGLELDLVPKHLSSARAEARLDGIHTQIERGETNADICFGFVGAAMQLAQKSRHRDKLLRQALDAAIAGSRAALQPIDRKIFRVMELSLRELLAGRKPTVEILYRCGLGSLATAAKQADPMVIVLSRGTSFRRLDAAA